MVEFALLVPVLFGIVCGSVDFGRVFARNASILGAAREAARQAVVYSPAAGTNAHFGQSAANDNYVRDIAKQELGITDSTTLTFLGGHENDCFSPANPPSGSTFYPDKKATDTGYVFVCWPSAPGNDGKLHVVVTITWTMSLVTPMVEWMIGVPHLHAVVEMTEQSP